MLEVAGVDGLKWEANHGEYSVPVIAYLGMRQWLCGVARESHLLGMVR